MDGASSAHPALQLGFHVESLSTRLAAPSGVDSAEEVHSGDTVRFTCKLYGIVANLLAYREVGEHGTEHLQGYLELTVKKTLQQLKASAPQQIAWFPRAGSQAQARDYCLKDWHPPLERYEPIPFVPNAQGKRSDLKAACDMVKAGASKRELAVTFSDTFVKYHKGLEALRTTIRPPVTEYHPPKCWWLYGATGVGKTRRAVGFRGISQTYKKSFSNKWWDGYNPDEHTVVLFDEFSRNVLPEKDEIVCNLLEWTDGYRQCGEVKGSYVTLIYEYVFVCSTDHPSTYFTHSTYTQVERRFHERIIELLDNEQDIVFE